MQGVETPEAVFPISQEEAHLFPHLAEECGLLSDLLKHVCERQHGPSAPFDLFPQAEGLSGRVPLTACVTKRNVL
jgi:hypothetical protein